MKRILIPGSILVAILVLGALRWGCSAPPAAPPSASATPRLLVSHREIPRQWQTRDFAGPITCGPDGHLYFVMLPGAQPAKLARFNLTTQVYETLCDLGTLAAQPRWARGVSVTAPVVFTTDGSPWMGTSAFPNEAGKRSGWLLAFDLATKSVRDRVEVPGRAVVDLACDRARGHLLALAAGGSDTRLFRYDLAAKTLTDLGVAAPGRGRNPALVLLDDGRAVVLAGERFLRYVPGAAALEETEVTLPAGSDGACALTHAGTLVYGITRATGRLFSYDLATGKVRELGPTYDDALYPGVRASREERMALCAGTDSLLYYAGYGEEEGAPQQGKVVRFDPRDGSRTALGAMASPAGVIAPPMAAFACAGPEGRVFMTGTGAPGCGLYAFPPLPEPIPWSTTDKTYACRRIADRAINIDGRLDEITWKKTTPLDNFVVITNGPTPPRFATTAWLVWSNTRLYFAFRCAGDALKSVGTNRDDDIWRGECAELFLAPRGGDQPYYEIEFNPDGAIFDCRCESYSWNELAIYLDKWKRGWNADIVAKTTVQRDAAGAVTGWMLEGSLPFAAIDGGAPKVGDTWLFNAMRIAHPAQGHEEYQTWHPTYADFHKPHQYPKLHFVK